VTERLGELAPIVARKRGEAESLRCAAAALWAKAEVLPAAPAVEVLRGGTVIAELKRRSPSGGAIRPSLDVAALALEYQAAGAAALSVLTDGPDFGGSLDDLAAARGAVRLPLLRKDFIVDPVQVAESRIAGADWVLLIVAVLGAPLLEACLDAVRRAHCVAVVEVHDEAEAEVAQRAGAACIGINNRDLRTLRTDLGTFGRVRRALRDDVIVVGESGVRDAGDVRRLMEEGADSVLVGETLLRAASPGEACAALVRAARGAVA
jgi:indole-3-glycerol phosphate synthase